MYTVYLYIIYLSYTSFLLSLKLWQLYSGNCGEMTIQRAFRTSRHGKILGTRPGTQGAKLAATVLNLNHEWQIRKKGGKRVERKSQSGGLKRFEDVLRCFTASKKKRRKKSSSSPPIIASMVLKIKRGKKM